MTSPVDPLLMSVLEASPAVQLDRPEDLTLARESRRHALGPGNGDIGLGVSAGFGLPVVMGCRYPVPGHGSHSGPVVPFGRHNPC